MSTEDPLTFPCIFPIKVMGLATDDFESTVMALLKPLLPRLRAEDIKRKQSSAGKYISMTITVEAESREQLDDIYRTLNACEKVLMTL